MTKRQRREVYADTITLRLTKDESARFREVMDLAKARNPYCDKSDVIRELIGLREPENLTPEDIEYFRTGKRKQWEKYEITT